MFKKLISNIKKGVFGAVKELISLMKKHPIVTGAVLTSAGFIMVKSGVYKKWASTLSSFAKRVSDGIKFIAGKKEMVDKSEYDAIKDTAQVTQKALLNAEKLNAECKINIDNLKKDNEYMDSSIKTLKGDNSRLQSLNTNRYEQINNLTKKNEELTKRNEELSSSMKNAFLSQFEDRTFKTNKVKDAYDSMIKKINTRVFTYKPLREFKDTSEYRELMDSIFKNKDDTMNRIEYIDKNMDKIALDWYNDKTSKIGISK